MDENRIDETIEDDELVCIVYVSAAIRELTHDELVQLLQTCRANNARTGITGLLLYKGGNFMQLLEGPRHRVTTLFERVRHDPRHHRVFRLLLEKAETRQFAEWSMAFGNIDRLGDRDREAASAFLCDEFSQAGFGTNPHKALRLLLDFKRTMR
jgi:hypothetical protein